MQYLTTACVLTFLTFLGHRIAQKGSPIRMLLKLFLIIGLAYVVATSALMLIGVIQ